MIDKIFNEDCLEGMKRIPDSSVDFVLTDLPYGITDAPFDVRIDLVEFWKQAIRVTKLNGAQAMFSQLPFAVDLINANRKNFRYEWVWRKNIGVGFLNAKKMPLRVHENILIFYRRLPTYNPQKWMSKPYRNNSPQYSTNYHIFSNGIIKNHVSESKDGSRYPVDIVNFQLRMGGGGWISAYIRPKSRQIC